MSRVNPKLSVYAYVFGHYNFSECPLAPLNTKVILHKKPDQRESWGYHGCPVWYVGPSLQHYFGFRCWVPDTGSE
eukprot:8191849-Ditylum_brightwellii.AAC.1